MSWVTWHPTIQSEWNRTVVSRTLPSMSSHRSDTLPPTREPGFSHCFALGEPQPVLHGILRRGEHYGHATPLLSAPRKRREPGFRRAQGGLRLRAPPPRGSGQGKHAYSAPRHRHATRSSNPRFLSYIVHLACRVISISSRPWCDLIARHFIKSIYNPAHFMT